MMGTVEKKYEKENFQQEITSLPRWRRSLYVGMFWGFMVCSLYTVIFFSWYGCLVPGTFAQLIYSFGIKKNKLAMIPHQKQLTAWLHATRFYDRFVRRANADKKLRLFRTRGFLLLFLGLSLLGISYSDPPVVDLNDMKVVRGTFEGYSERGRKNPCGSLLLTIRLEDGTLAKFRDGGANLKNLYNNKGMDVIIWEEPTPHSIIPECREFPAMAQIQSKGYTRFYNKQRSEKIHLWTFIAGIAFTIGGSVVMLIIALKSEEI